MTTLTKLSIEDLNTLELYESDTTGHGISEKFDTGPLFRLGDITIHERAWEQLPSNLLCFALEAHQRGVWGNTAFPFVKMYDEQIARSVDGYINYGLIMSTWAPKDRRYPPFHVQSVNGTTKVFLIDEGNDLDEL